MITDNFEDIIDFSTNVSEPEKIPDIVKTLREFSGKPGEFNSWRKAWKGHYPCTLSTEADAVPEAYRTTLDWSAIRKCLVLHYSDKRDISTVEYQMSILTQRHLTVAELYRRVFQYLSLILDKIDCLEAGEESLRIFTKTYREKALDNFVRILMELFQVWLVKLTLQACHRHFIPVLS